MAVKGTPLTAAEVHRLTTRRFEEMRPFRAGRIKVPDDAPLPPGPGWPMLVQSVALLRFRHWFQPWLSRRFGETFTVRIIPAGSPLVLFTRPEDVKEIFAGDPEYFLAGRGNSILGPVMGAHSLLLLDQDDHKRARKLLMPAFNGASLRGYRSLVDDLAAAEVGTWQPGETFRALDRMNALTLEVILRVVFGVTEDSRLAQLRPLVNQLVDVSPVVLFGWSFPRLQKMGTWRRMVEVQYALDRLIYAEIGERLDAPDLAARTDVLSRLIAAGAAEDAGRGAVEDTGEDAGRGDSLGPEELRDQLMTLLLAGHETTATGLAWALYELGRDPVQARRAALAADEGDEDYLEAVFKESLRLHPVIPIVNRTLTEPATIGGWELPAGTTIGPSILLAHARQEAYPDPERFDPERFLGTNPPVNTWIPFGGGVRRCIGAGFSVMEGVAVLRAVLSRYDVSAVGADRPKVRNITSVPGRGARIRVSPR